MDLLFSALEALDELMQSGPGLFPALFLLLVMSWPLTLLHELGHALAAVVLLDEDVDVEVGQYGRFAEGRLGRIRFELQAPSLFPGVAGTAGFDDARATARDILLIALAGPAASALGAVATALLLGAVGESGWLHDVLWAATLNGIFFTLLNTVPFAVVERRGEAPTRSDGLLALDALRVIIRLRAV